MPATTRRFVARFAVAPAVLLAAAVALVAQPDPPKKPADTPAPTPKDAKAGGIKLPDGTFLWTGEGERIVLTPEELQKVLDQVEQLKKQLAARKPAAPSGCAIVGGIAGRGDAVVAALKVTYTFRTTAPNAAVALGGKRAFLVSAALDGNKLPILDTGEDGLAALVETAGDHTLALEFEAPVSGRGTKAEIGFELGLPRAAITTLQLTLPAEVKRVSLATRTPDPAKPPEVRRVPALDVKQLAPRPGQEAGYPLGPVDQVEVSWEPPAAAAPADAGPAADIEVVCELDEAQITTTAKFRLRGAAREWRIVSPGEPIPARPGGAPDVGASPVVGKPADPNQPVWKVEFPAGATPADWVFTAKVTQERPKPEEAGHKGPFAVGPFSVTGVTRQTGTVRVKATANNRLTFQQGPELRRDAPMEEDVAAAFRLVPGPTDAAPRFQPLLRVEAETLKGTVRIKPVYTLDLTPAGWRLKAELKVTPIRTEVDAITFEVPASWPRAIQVDPPRLVVGVPQDEPKPEATRRTVTIRLDAAHKQPFDLLLNTTLPVPPGTRELAVPLLVFPEGTETDTTVTATVPIGLEVRGMAREWEGGQPAGWGQPLAAVPGPDGKPPKTVAAVGGKFDHGLARVDLAWQPHRPELTAEIRAEVTVGDRQAVVTQQVKLRAPEGFARPVRFQGPPALAFQGPGASLEPVGAGEWAFTPPAEAKDAALTLTFPVALPPRPAGDRGPWKLPVSLVWPTGATRTETVVRVWAGGSGGRVIAADPGAWRELPPEPVAERDAMPAATLAGSGPDLPLVLDVQEINDPSAATVWVERGLIQTVAAADGTVTYRARFLLKRWLTDSVELRLPGPTVGPAPEILIDDPPRKAGAVPVADSGGDRVFLVALPGAKPGRAVVLEVRYQLPGDSLHVPPRPKAAFAGPVRWQFTPPPGSVPLVVGDGGAAEQRWRLRLGLLAPGPIASADDLDRWFRTGTEPDGAGADDAPGGFGEPVILRLARPEPVRVYRVSGIGLVVGCSVGLLLLGLVVVRLPGGMAGLVVAGLGGAAAVAAVLVPQPAGQVAGAAEPGVAAILLVFGVQAVARRYHRRRVTHLPGFTRVRPEPEEPLPAAPSGQAPQNGSTGPVPPSAREPRPAPSGS